MPSTTLENLYDVLCEVVTKTTGRRAWSKVGIQATPNGPYATVYLSEGAAPATQDVVETRLLASPGEDGETIFEHPWGQVRLDCVAEFFRDTAIGVTAQADASRFRNGLQISARFDDIWLISGLTGPIKYIDISAVFRSDTESRAQVRFSLYANIADLPLDASIFQIDAQGVDVYRDTLDPPPVASIEVSRFAGAGTDTEDNSPITSEQDAGLMAEKGF